MNHLVSNGAHLLRRSSHLVRTPIGVPLACDEMAVYQVADNYTNGWPSGGFIDQATYWTVQTTGRKMLDAYVNHYSTRGNIIWRKVTTSHRPEFAWYQERAFPARRGTCPVWLWPRTRETARTGGRVCMCRKS